MNITVIDISNNNITIVRNNIFTSMRNHVQGSVWIRLNHNSISVIQDLCFNGLEDKIVGLQLDNNNLQAIPTAIGNLTIITALYIMFNPIRYLNPAILLNIGNTLSSASFSFTFFKHWPTDLRLLLKLTELYTTHFNGTSIRTNEISIILYQLLLLCPLK